jgi:transposase InsO family protein
MLEDEGVKIVHTRYQAPDMNAFAERWARSIKTECLSNLILVGARSLEDAVRSFADHHNSERSHQGIASELVTTTEVTATGPVIITERPGGVLEHYHRSAD